jgi:molecular chaperone GrpE
MNKHRNDNTDEESSDSGVGSPSEEMAETAGAESDLQAKLAEKDKEIAELKDKYLRALADGENIRKRVRQQSDETIRIQKEALLRDLLPIVDNLERAIEAARTGASGGQVIVQGVEMVLRSLADYLRAHGVAPIDSAGHPFDPSRHEAVDHVHSEVHPPNTVVDEFHRGYLIGERVLRPARVTVAKGRAGGRSNGESGSSGVENH